MGYVMYISIWFKGYVSENFNDGSFFRVTSNIGPKSRLVMFDVKASILGISNLEILRFRLIQASVRYLHDRRNR